MQKQACDGHYGENVRFWCSGENIESRRTDQLPHGVRIFSDRKLHLRETRGQVAVLQIVEHVTNFAPVAVPEKRRFVLSPPLFGNLVAAREQIAEHRLHVAAVVLAENENEFIA